MRYAVIWTLGSVCCLAGAAQAQIRWQATVLHPGGAYESFAYAVDGGMQGGFVDPAGSQDYGFPTLWFGSPDSLVNLLPAGNWDRGDVYAMQGGRQVGQVLAANVAQHAALWYGSAGSFVDLHPSGYRSSIAEDVAGDQVVGLASPNGSGNAHAVVWNLTDRTLTDLHPPGARWSRGYATDGRWQGGEAQFPDLGYAIHAVLWSGSAESATDLNPFGAKTSTINDMAAGVQIGDAPVGTQNVAVLWRGHARVGDQHDARRRDERPPLRHHRRSARRQCALLRSVGPRRALVQRQPQ
ncbi:MAG: hypothetical protein IPJ41_14650 [Phycisphaerales bacterium]|nr:hypothetical protein [Phycisphaerales bacterium]